jgi:hypothetical protein
LICPDFTCRKTNSNQKQKNNTAKIKEIEMKCTMRKKKLNLGKRLEQSETEFTGIVDHLLCYSYFKEIKKKFLLEEFSQTPHMPKIMNNMNKHFKLSYIQNFIYNKHKVTNYTHTYHHSS